MTVATLGKCELQEIPLSSICANSGQTRGYGVMAQLLSLGYGVFEKASVDADKEPIWAMLTSDKPDEQKYAAVLIREHEPDIVSAAESQESWGQFQPIRVVKLDDGTYDVVFGMTRALARAFLHASDPKNNPDTIEAMVMDKAPKSIDLLWMGFAENNDRREESPIDRAMFFAKNKKEFKLDPKDIGEKAGLSAQAVRDYIKLLHPKLEDKRMEIHNGELGMYKALKLLERRLVNAADDTNGSAPSGARARFPGAKKIEQAYKAKKKPDWMEQKEWEIVIKDDVRKWIAYRLGKKFSPFTGEVLTEEPKEVEEEAPASQVFKYTITKKTAIKLLTALGKPEAEGWENKVLADKLENIVNLAEEGTTLDDPKLQGILTKLLTKYKDGILISIKEDK